MKPKTGKRVWDMSKLNLEQFHYIEIGDIILAYDSKWKVDEFDKESFDNEIPEKWYKVLRTHNLEIKDEEDENYYCEFSEYDLLNPKFFPNN